MLKFMSELPKKLTNLSFVGGAMLQQGAKPLRAIKQIDDESNELWLSVASVWEMGIKVAIAKLPLSEPLDSYISSRMAQLGVR